MIYEKKWNTTRDTTTIIVEVVVHDLIGWLVDLGFGFCDGALGIGFGGKDGGGGGGGDWVMKLNVHAILEDNY